jgi:hypothetical protein
VKLSTYNKLTVFLFHYHKSDFGVIREPGLGRVCDIQSRKPAGRPHGLEQFRHPGESGYEHDDW